MSRCTCANTGGREPGYVYCPVNHDAIRERIESMREALLSNLDIILEGLAWAEGDIALALATAKTGDELLAARTAAVAARLDVCLGRQRDFNIFGLDGDELDERVLRSFCRNHGIDPDSLDPTGSTVRGLSAAGGCASQLEVA